MELCLLSSEYIQNILSLTALAGLTAPSPEIDCDQKAIGLPPVTCAIFLIAKSL
jgi:hypothetical protein